MRKGVKMLKQSIINLNALAPPFSKVDLLKVLNTLPQFRRLIQSKRTSLLSQIQKCDDQLERLILIGYGDINKTNRLLLAASSRDFGGRIRFHYYIFNNSNVFKL